MKGENLKFLLKSVKEVYLKSGGEAEFLGTYQDPKTNDLVARAISKYDDDNDVYIRLIMQMAHVISKSTRGKPAREYEQPITDYQANRFLEGVRDMLRFIGWYDIDWVVHK